MTKLKTFCTLLIIFIYLIACESTSPIESEDPTTNYSETLQEYFPSNTELSYNYSVDTLNSSDGIFHNIGNRISTFNSKEMNAENEYYLYDNLYKLNDSEFRAKTRFRYSENSLLLLTDTTHVSESIPDSLAGQLKIYIEEETKLLEFPLEQNKVWPVLKVNIDFGVFKFNILDIAGEYIGSETLIIDSFNEPLESDKIKYKLDLNVPDLSNPFISKVIKTYYSEVWFVKGKGIVKLEGCSLFINPLSGMYINFSDSNKVSRQTLISLN